MELRTKLDWTRTKADKDVRRARAQASALRAKWAILSGEGESSLLDTVRVDSPHMNHSSSAPGAVGVGGAAAAAAAAASGHGGSNNANNNNNNNNSKSTNNHVGGLSRGAGTPPTSRGGGIGGGGGGGVGVTSQQRGGRGPMAPSLSEAAFPGRQQQHRSATAGIGGVRGGGSPQGGMPLNPAGGLSAGTDPGGLLGDSGSRGGSGAAGNGAKGRPPWSEQGGGAGKGVGGGRQASQQVLYA